MGRLDKKGIDGSGVYGTNNIMRVTCMLTLVNDHSSLTQWLKDKKFGVETSIRERLAIPIRGVGTR